LGALPKAFRYVIEFRHAGWDQAHREMLARHRAALCLHDRHFQAQAAPATTNFLYVRWLGSRTQLTKFNRVQIERRTEQAWWSALLRAQLGKGLDVYGFVNNRWAGHAPTSAQQLLKAIIEKPGKPR
jgi:uncharacterized protein YecE (DUF72 family)